MRAWNVGVRETLDGGNLTHKVVSIEAATVTDAITQAQADIDRQPEHAHRYEIVSATLSYETPAERPA